MSSIRKTPEYAAYGLLPTEAAADEVAADEAAADEAAEVAEEVAEAAEEAAVSGLDPSGSASSSSSPRIRTKAAGECHRPRRDRARTISISRRSPGERAGGLKII